MKNTTYHNHTTYTIHMSSSATTGIDLASLHHKDWKLISQSCLLSGLKQRKLFRLSRHFICFSSNHMLHVLIERQLVLKFQTSPPPPGVVCNCRTSDALRGVECKPGKELTYSLMCHLPAATCVCICVWEN